MRTICLMRIIGLLVLGTVGAGGTKRALASEHEDKSPDPGVDVEGDILAFSQSELRQVLGGAYGFSLLSATPWQSMGVHHIRPYGAPWLLYLELGRGSRDLDGQIHHISVDHRVESVVTSIKAHYFFSDYLPFYLGFGGGLVSWHSRFKPLSPDVVGYDARGNDGGVYMGVQGGLMWITQSGWLLGVNILNGFQSLKLLSGSNSGSGQAKRHLAKNLQKSYLQVGLGVSVSYSFDL